MPELSVKVSDFEKQIEYLNKNFTCISLTEMCQRIKDGKRPDQLYFSITFDDGYADNYKFGYPILHKYRNKATIFVTTEYVNDNSISPYWDEIKEYSNTTHGKINFQDRNGDILDFNLSSLKGKRNFINTVNNMIFSNKLSIKDLSRIIKSKKVNNQKRNNDFFTWNLLKKALASGNYEVGSHTKTHPILGILDDNGKDEIDTAKFLKKVRNILPLVGLDDSFLHRSVNDGFSGGEKKRNEILQMLVLEPKLSILDETDSGLDIDALKIISEGISSYRSNKRSFILITHYHRMLDFLNPDYVHVLLDGTIAHSGGSELAMELEKKGYSWIKENKF